MNVFIEHVRAFLFFVFILMLGAFLMGVNNAGDSGFNAGIMLTIIGGASIIFDLVFFIRAE